MALETPEKDPPGVENAERTGARGTSGITQAGYTLTHTFPDGATKVVTASSQNS